MRLALESINVLGGDPGFLDSKINRSGMDEIKFKQLLERYEKGLLSAKERALLEAWLEELGKNNEPVTWSTREKENLKRSILNKIAHEDNALQPQSPGKQLASLWIKWAAAFLVIAIATTVVWTSKDPVPLRNQSTAHTDSGPNAITKLILSDGTLVWLKGESELIYPETFVDDVRLVTLKGQALFEVAKDPSRPFEVRSEDVKTRVLGTSFQINTKEKQIEIAVLTGKVKVTKGKTTTELNPGRKAICEKGRTIIQTADLDDQEIRLATTGTEYLMNFEETLVSEVMLKLERKFDKRFVLPDPDRLRHCHLTADLTDQSLDVSLSVMAKTLGFTYSLEGNGITIQGGGCE